MTRRIVLASASPRRQELLRLIVPKFEILAVDIDEDRFLRPPIELGVRNAARAKADKASELSDGALVIAADTIVVLDETVMGKPSSPADAVRMLKMLSGRSHRVMTGLAVAMDGNTLTACEITTVQFTQMSDADIKGYLDTGEPFDKAGAYGIQGRASVFIEKIDGCYFNVVGLPVFRLSRLLKEAGYDPAALWRGK